MATALTEPVAKSMALMPKSCKNIIAEKKASIAESAGV